jgi:biopolymer transport protein ExbD
MAAGSSPRALGGASSITGINVTPLVDITLVLLIVFMVTAKVIVRRESLPVDLPKAAAGEHTQEIFSVVVPADGTVQVDGSDVLDDEALLGLARTALRRNGDLRAVIQADGGVAHRRVMHLLDLLKTAGITKVAFGVNPTTAPSAASTDGT